MNKPLTLDQLKDMITQSREINIHIWVELMDICSIYAAITDVVDDVGVVAIWCAGDKDDWLREDTYGIEWQAYARRPTIGDRWNFAGAHLNGMEARPNIRKIDFNPWIELYARRRKKQRNIRHSNIRTAESIRKRIITFRQQFIGSDFSVNKLVQLDEKPWEGGAERLAGYLADKSYAIMCREYSRTGSGNGEWCRDWFDGFFKYTTQYFANGGRGTLDDYILFAESFENSPNAIRIVFSEHLPAELADEAAKWVCQNEDGPTDLSRCVIGAVACLTGAMVEPKEMEE